MNILLTSAGRRAYIVDYFKSCNGIGKVHASNSEYSIALQRSDGYFISPLIYSDEYIPSILNYCKKNDISAIVSLFDIDLLILAQNRDVFEKNSIRLILAPEEFVKICNDKWLTYQFLKRLNIPTPLSFKNISDVKKAIAEGIINYPIIMKPRWGMASIGIYKIENDDELYVLTNKCHREIFNSYLKFESGQTPNEAIIYQELINGDEFGLDVLNNLNGNYIATFAKQKVTMRSGETDLGKTVDPKPFEDIAKLISQNSLHQGILSVDCFKTDNKIYVIEMNCRISGHYPIAYLAGFNYPQILIDWLNGLPTQEKLLRFETNQFVVKDLVPTILKK